MKLKKVMITIVLLVACLLPLQAKHEPQSILIVSKQFPFIIHAQSKPKQVMEIRFIPTNMLLPLICTAQPTTFNSIDIENEMDCIKTSIEKIFSLSSSNMLYLHLDKLANDVKLPYDDLDFYDLKDLTAYFNDILKALNLKTLLHYNTYVQSDLSFQDYYRYYKLFKNKKIKLQYYFLDQIYLDDTTIPLELTFHRYKKRA